MAKPLYRKLRLAPRYDFHVESLPRVHFRLTESEDGFFAEVRNLSHSGLCFSLVKGELTDRIAMDSKLILEISPKENQPIVCHGKIVRVDDRDTIIEFGLAFEALPLLFEQKLAHQVSTAIQVKNAIQVAHQEQKQTRRLPAPSKRYLWILFAACLILLEVLWLMR